MSKSQQVFFELVRAGLWEKEVRLLPFGEVNYSEVMRLAEEQSVVGLVTAGLEHVSDVKIPKEDILQFVGKTMQLEQQNSAMNQFIGVLVERMRKDGIYTLVLKGQGVAQCYEKPLWRSFGDVDFFLSEENFIKAREYLRPIVNNGFDPAYETARNISAQISSWDIELHSNQFCGLSKRMDKGVDELRKAVFERGRVRTWMNGEIPIFLPGVDEDVLFVFTHFLKHFYKGGLGLRQICDWCRLLWTYKEIIDVSLLKARLQSMQIETEWKAFGAYAVDFLGMPKEAMPLYDTCIKWFNKARRINNFILEVGNMGHNRDNRFYGNKSFLVRKVCSFSRRVGDLCNHAMVFPVNSMRFFPSLFFNGIKLAAKGVG